MRKPHDLSMQEYMVDVNELNEFLKEFPGFVEGQELQHDEIMDIAEYGVPATWQRAMVVHGFNPLDHTVPGFIEFCEQMEFSEAQESTEGTKSKTTSKKGKNGATLHAKSSEEAQSNKCRFSDEEKYCKYHKVHGHDTGECKAVLSQVKKMRKLGSKSKQPQFQKVERNVL